MIRIIQVNQEVVYSQTYITFKKIKENCHLLITQEFMDRYTIHKKFNSKTGKIEKKYAWDSMIFDLKKNGGLRVILDYVLEKEKEA